MKIKFNAENFEAIMLFKEGGKNS